ncbi:MAG: hypothetical protein K0S19_1425 [Geminicoccaceae bacterium]|nr:hypothetical protein [Geminicoccaceae bacterium]
MAGSYRQCDACGKRALSIANRCPGCGRDFPAREVEKGERLELGRFLTPKGIAAVLAVGAVLVSARSARTAPPGEVKAEVASSVASTRPVETAGVAPPRAAQPGVESAEVKATTARRSPVKTARVAAPPAERGRELRVAQNWTEVRKSRSVRAPVEALLTPGDTVLADSLAGGWYRVALEGEVLGYAHHSTLAALGVAME